MFVEVSLILTNPRPEIICHIRSRDVQYEKDACTVTTRAVERLALASCTSSEQRLCVLIDW